MIDRLVTLTNEKRERDAVVAVLAATPPDPAPTAYGPLVTTYPGWAAIHECGVARTNDRHRTVSDGLFHSDFTTCIDLDETKLNRYFKTMVSYKRARAGQIIFTIPERNAMITLIQWAKDLIRCGKDPAKHQFEKKYIPDLIGSQRLMRCMWRMPHQTLLSLRTSQKT